MKRLIIVMLLFVVAATAWTEGTVVSDGYDYNYDYVYILNFVATLPTDEQYYRFLEYYSKGFTYVPRITTTQLNFIASKINSLAYVTKGDVYVLVFTRPKQRGGPMAACVRIEDAVTREFTYDVYLEVSK